MRSSLFTLFLLSLEAAPASSLRIPLPLQSPSPRLADASGKGIGARWTLDLKPGMGKGMEKRRKSIEGDIDPSGQQALSSGSKDEDEDEGRRRTRPHKAGKMDGDEDDGKRRPRTRPHKEGKADGNEVAEIMKANDGVNTQDGNDDNNEDGRPVKGKGGKKQKHIPGSHHREDRLPPTEDKHPKHRPHSGKGRHERRYLSSNPRYHTKKELSIWDYDRHIKRMGAFDPLHGTGMREEVEMQKRGHGADEREGGRHGKDDKGGRHLKHDAGGRGRHGKHGVDRGDGGRGRHEKDELHIDGADVRGKDFHAIDQAGHIDRPHINAVDQGDQVRGDSLPDLHGQNHLPTHRQGVTLGDGLSAQSKSLASPARADAAHRDQDLNHNEARGLLDPLRVDDMLGLEYEAYDCEEEYGLGHHTLFGRDDQDQTNVEAAPAPGPPQSVSVIDGGPRLFADRIIWQPQSDHPEKHGGLERRRKNKHKDDEDDDEERGGKHGRNRHGDDEDGYGSSSGKHRGGDEEDKYGSSRSMKGKGRFTDDEEEEDDYSAKSSGSRSKGKGAFDDDDVPYSKSDPLSDYDDEDDFSKSKPKTKSKFDDGQYRPSSYANSGVDDCATLSSFYTSMKGETWTPAVDWSSSAVSSKKTACCSWTGVNCDEFERVIGVDVSMLGLSGPLSSELFSLDALLRL